MPKKYLGTVYLVIAKEIFQARSVFFPPVLVDTTEAVKSWPKVLSMTQILIFTKFAASVSLDIFCQMLLWNTEV
jgi:hypothetical protein